jgi:peptidoglycan/xylan/chitin deacetylase (PgdA/CDA1 family)
LGITKTYRAGDFGWRGMELRLKRFWRKTRHVLFHPLVIIPILVIVMLIGWHYYIKASQDLDSPNVNVLADTSFNDLVKGVPAGWQLTKSGQSHISTTLAKGYASGNSFEMTMSDYRSGSDELSSPVTLVKDNTVYLYKGFYKSSMPFDLLARYTYTNGSAQLYLIHTYPQTGANWSAASDSFKTNNQVESIQFLYRISGNGSLSINGEYLEADSDIYMQPSSTTSTANLIQNSELSTDQNGNPMTWNAYQTGNNQIQSGLNSKVSPPYLYLEMSRYVSGESSWQPQAISVSPFQYFNFGFNYQSNVKADVVAEYQLNNGSYVFETVDVVNPANEWTRVSIHFEAPNNAISLIPYVDIQADGYLNTSGYYLYDNTNTSLANWSQPMITLTFDGGYQSVYDNAASQLKADGFKSTYYLNPASIDTKGVMSVSELQSLQNEGNEIASQGYHYIDLTTVNSKRIDSEMADSKQYLDQTFNQDTTDFAAPYGNIDSQVQLSLRKYYESNRSTATGININQSYDPYNLRVFYVGSKTTANDLQNAINQAKQYNGWLILVYNQIDNGKPGSNSGTTISSSQFNQQLSLIKQNGIKVDTVNQAVTAIAKLNHK